MQSVERTLLLSATSANSDGPAGNAPLRRSGPATRDSAGADISAHREADVRNPRTRDYRPGLATSELLAEIRGLLATERRAECLLCRYLADLADRIGARQDAELGGFADELDAARHWFGLGARDARERVRVGRALRTLPEIERAFMDGELSYSRVREVTRVATVASELGWLELARRLDMRSLERRVAAQRVAAGSVATGEQSDRYEERRLGARARTQWVGPGRVRVTFELSVEAWTVLQRAMREARRAGSCGPGDGHAREAIARTALSVPRDDPRDAGDGTLSHQWPTRDEIEEDGDAADPEGDRSAADSGRSIAEARAWGGVTGGRTALELGTDATQGGSATGSDMDATQGGSAEGAPGPGDRRIDGERSGSGFVDQAREPAMRLMEVMGRGRGWTLDALTEASGLSVQEVSVALTLLEVGGRVRRRAFAFEPV